MSEWTDRVRTHPVWLQMEALGPALDQALSREGIDPPAIEGLERIRAILTFAGKRLAGIEPQLVQQGPLDRLAISFQQAVDNVTTYTTNGDADQYQENVTELKQKYSDEAQIILDKITEHKSDVEKLVGVIGNLGVTSGYQKVANQAWWTAIIWQGIAVASMICVIVFAFVAFLPLTQGTFSWQNFAGRIVLSIAVGVLAAYAAAQADRQLEIERRNRKLALELEAIGPYLAPLPVEQQVAFRLQIGERTFGRDDVAVGRRGDKSPATVIDVLSKSKEFREFITDIVKAARG